MSFLVRALFQPPCWESIGRKFLSAAIVFLILPLAHAADRQSVQSKGAPENTTYVFERMWPTLLHPWYFYGPTDLAIDDRGNVYILDADNARIRKFNADGAFLVEWGSSGSGLGQFNQPASLAVDSSGNVYVVDSGNSRIQKFNTDGVILLVWGEPGSDVGQFDAPAGIAVDLLGHIYVVEGRYSRIQKFTSNGLFLDVWYGFPYSDRQFDFPGDIAVDASGDFYVVDTVNHRIVKLNAEGDFLFAWGSEGSGPGQFTFPTFAAVGLAIDLADNVYVVDTENHRIQKFTSGGSFLAEWGEPGPGPGQFFIPRGIAVDDTGSVFVSDLANDRVQKFTPDGVFATEWRSYGSGSGEFHAPTRVADSPSGHIYVLDSANGRIQKFTPAGAFLSEWGSWGSGPGQFESPSGLGIGGDGSVYVTDSSSHRVQKFSSDGVFLTEWGSYGSGPGQFWNPSGLAVDSMGHVYVGDDRNFRVQKFTGDGSYLGSWGTSGTDAGEFSASIAIAIDGLDNVFTVERFSHRVQKFSSNGGFLAAFGTQGSAPGQFGGPTGIAIDGANNIYVADVGNERIQKFAPDGSFLVEWGGAGSAPARFFAPVSVTVDSVGSVYVADTGNDRLQKFRPVVLSPNRKAIVVAGGGPFPGNTLWTSTQFCANFAYRALAHRGFAKDSVYYLSSNATFDLDGNGEFDDVDGDATNTNLEFALTQWALDAEELVVYLVDHGGVDTFRMSGTETLSSSQLAQWLGVADQSISGTITVVYEACQSGSFLNDIAAPGRLVLTSADTDQSAYFLNVGTISFSSFFWTEVFNGATVGQAFDVARTAIELNIGLQTPQINDPGGLANTFYLGSDVQFIGEAPILNEISPAQSLDGEASASLYALPFDEDGIARVWAVIRPPGFAPTSPDNPVLNLPTLELFPTDGLKTRWEGTYDFFTSLGTYQIAVYCRDAIGNTSLPILTTVAVTSPLARRAVLATGEALAKANPTAVSRLIQTARDALTGQGYGANDIRVYGPDTLGDATGAATLANLQDALTNWAGMDTQDIVFYYVGDANDQGLVLGAEILTPEQLDSWLDTAQGVMPGRVMVLIDASNADTFVGPVRPPAGKERIVLAATSENTPAAFLASGAVAFSNYFWVRVLNGTNVDRSYQHAARAMRFVSGQKAIIDDNGNGVGNEREDGIVARKHIIGAGVLFAGDDPVIGSIDEGGELGDATDAIIAVNDVTTTGSIESVTAFVQQHPSGYSAPILTSVALASSGNNRYTTDFAGFTTTGAYTVSVVAIDAEGNASLPATTRYTKNYLFDPNDDGIWDAVDIQFTINAALGLPSEADTDLNGDGATDAVDVQLAINAVLGV